MSASFLFTYGWLKKKYHKQLPFNMPSSFVGEAYTFGSLYKVAEYPGIKLIGNNKVFGEIYSIDKDFDWIQMDEFENASPTVKVAPEYRRVKVKCFIGVKEYQCWIYEFLDEPLQSNWIKSGIF